jgi:hypothetical protein
METEHTDSLNAIYAIFPKCITHHHDHIYITFSNAAVQGRNTATRDDIPDMVETLWSD